MTPNDVCRANIKVSSTETGAIFGNIVYESTGYAERSVIVLNDIHIDIMDYISPASCPDVQFRSMWAEFEWENKVRGHCCELCLLSHACLSLLSGAASWQNLLSPKVPEPGLRYMWNVTLLPYPTHIASQF